MLWFPSLCRRMYKLLLFFVLFIELSIYSSSVTAYTSYKSSRLGLTNKLVFPDSEENDLSIPICNNGTFCEKLENYPTQTFHEILTSKPYSTRYSQFFENFKQNEQMLKIRSANEHFICPSTKSIVFPKAAYNVKDEIKFIYNLPSYRQGVSIEVCVKKSKCKFYDKVKNFRTMCKQKFVEKLLLTADDSGRPYVDRYKFPSTCVCSYRPERNYLRFSRLYK